MGIHLPGESERTVVCHEKKAATAAAAALVLWPILGEKAPFSLR